MLHPFYLGQTKAKHEQIEPTISDPVTSFGNLIYYNASWPHPAEVQNINSVNYVDAWEVYYCRHDLNQGFRLGIKNEIGYP
jgi:hypothetical protein